MKSLNEIDTALFLSLRMMIEIIAQILGMIGVTSFAIYLAGITWLCFKEMRQPVCRWVTPAVEPPETDEYDLLVTLAILENEPDRIWTDHPSQSVNGVGSLAG